VKVHVELPFCSNFAPFGFEAVEAKLIKDEYSTLSMNCLVD
jgi:hypothetical protein